MRLSVESAPCLSTAGLKRRELVGKWVHPSLSEHVVIQSDESCREQPC
jgi:hypothetical protein